MSAMNYDSAGVTMFQRHACEHRFSSSLWRVLQCVIGLSLRWFWKSTLRLAKVVGWGWMFVVIIKVLILE
jgi:hypothetical protein